eukprot:jgi/Galph1/5744/GphlegSOOS_G4374.1
MNAAQKALETLLSLVYDSKTHDTLVQVGIAPALVKVLSKSNQEARLLRQAHLEEDYSDRCLDRHKLSILLTELCKSTCTHQPLMEADIISPLIDLLQDMGWRVNNSSGFKRSFSWFPSWTTFSKKQDEKTSYQQIPQKSTLSSTSLTVAPSSQEETMTSRVYEVNTEQEKKRYQQNSSLLLNLAKENDVHFDITNLCIQSISSLAKDDKIIDHLVQSPILYPVMDIIQHHVELPTKREAMLIIASLAKAEGNIFLKNGALTLLINYVGDQDSVLNTYATGGLLNLMKHGDIDIHRQFIKAQGHFRLLQLCETVDASNQQSRIYAVLTLAELFKTSHPKASIIRQKLIESGTLRVWKDILVHSQDDMLLKNVCKAIWLCGQEPQAIMAIGKEIDDKVLNRLTSLLSQSWKEENVQHVLASQENLVVGLVSLLTTKTFNDNIPQAAVSILAVLSKENHCHQQLCNAACLSALMKAPATPNISLSLVSILANLSKNDSCRVLVAHEGGLPLLLKFANSKDTEIRREAARALYNLCRPGVSRIMVVQAGGLRTLLSLMSSSDDDALISKFAIASLASIAESFENVPRLAELGAATLIVRKLQNTKKPTIDTVRYSVLFIAEMANIMEIHSLLAQSGVIPLLLSCCTSRDLETQQYALMALCNLSATEAVRPLIKQSGATRILGIVLRSAMPLPETQGMAAAILANLNKGEQNMIHIQPISAMNPC